MPHIGSIPNLYRAPTASFDLRRRTVLPLAQRYFLD